MAPATSETCINCGNGASGFLCATCQSSRGKGRIQLKRTGRLINRTFQHVDRIMLNGVPTRVYQYDVHDGHLTVLVSHYSDQGWHLSISHRTNEIRPKPGRYPTWDEIADARYQLLPNDITMAMLLPPRQQYLNLHDTTFHLHEIPNDGNR